MIRFARSLAALVALAAVAGPAVAGGSELSKKAGPESRILVRFADGVSAQQAADINRRLGVTVVRTVLDGQVMVVEVPYPETRQLILDAYARTSGVAYAEPDGPVSIPTPVTPDSTRPGKAPDDGAPIRILPTD